ncbi:MAG: glycosyltransferase family 2 protein [Nitrososphaerota archaeon]|jgi:glycosyltransferase involved in cell wall biosynthesis|nr:glycosyltransferase family 2 protein [Nitrososphaerota archaeon]
MKPEIIMGGGVAIFVILGIMAYVMKSPLTLISLILAFTISFYLLALPRGQKGFNERAAGERKIPPVVLLLVLISPVFFSVLVAFQGFVLWGSVVLVVVAIGLMLTFWVDIVTVPLAMMSGFEETKSTGGPGYFPTVSVIIPAFNEEKVIARTIESVIEADYPKKQVIVVDDGSSDGTLEVAKRYSPNILVLHKENGGKSSALNYGLRYAGGDIIVAVDADTTIGRESLKEVARCFIRREVVAVSGNVKVLNRQNWLTRCQALEYIVSIQIVRRALDRFGCVTVVPGSLGAFRRETLEETGNYDRDTLTEDFDATLKVLKTGAVVQASPEALAYTQAPRTLRDFYRQRSRWYSGNFQTFRKHSDVITNPRYGFLYELGFPFMLITMAVVPFAGLVVWGAAIAAIILGQGLFLAEIFVLFLLLQFFLSLLAIEMDGEDKKLLLYAPFFVVGYKQLVDVITILSIVKIASGMKPSWTRAERIEIESSLLSRSAS